VSSNPLINYDSYGIVKCPGGRWWTAGNSTVSSFFVISLANSTLKWVCKKAQLYGKYLYKDQAGDVVFEQKIIKCHMLLEESILVTLAQA